MKRKAGRAVLAVVLVALPFVLLRDERVRGALLSLIAFLRTAGPAGLVVFFALEAAAGVLLVPVWLLAAMAGYVYGFGGGLLVAAPGVTISALAGWLVGKLVVRAGRLPSLARGAWWRAVQRATEREGLKVALLLRLTPLVPQNLLHLLLATTPLSARSFALGTFLGLLPAMAFHVYWGSLIQDATALVANEGASQGKLRWVGPLLALGATAVAVALLARVGRRMLAETLAADPPDEATDNLAKPPAGG